MHATCTYMLLLLIQYMHAVHRVRIRVSVTFCFSVGIVVSDGRGGGQKSQNLILAIL